MYGNPYGNCNIIWANSEADARAHPVAPGCSALIMDRNEQIFYIKSVDTSGMPMFRKFSYKEIIEAPAPSGDYVSREEFNALMAQLAALNRELGVNIPAQTEVQNNG